MSRESQGYIACHPAHSRMRPALACPARPPTRFSVRKETGAEEYMACICRRPIGAHLCVDLPPLVVQLIVAVELVVGRETNVLDVAVGVNVVRVANVVGVPTFCFFGASSAAGLAARLPAAARSCMPPALPEMAAYSNIERFFATGLPAAKPRHALYCLKLCGMSGTDYHPQILIFL